MRSSVLDDLGAALRRVRSALPTPVWLVLLLAIAIVYPFTVNDSIVDASIEALAYVILALGLNIVVGFAGLLDLGYVAFYAIGAFVTAWLGSEFFNSVNGGQGIHILAESTKPSITQGEVAIPGIHIDFWMVIFVAAAFTALWGAILGAPTLRLRGDYLAIVTLAFGEIVPRVFENIESVSNGRQGIQPVDGMTLVPFIGNEKIDAVQHLEQIYWVALAMVCITLFLNFRLRDSRLGRAWIAVREDEVAASAMGINLVRTKLWAYGMGAALGGFGGALFGAYRQSVNVDQFKFQLSVFILAMVIIGGMGNIWGVVLGAIVLAMINKYLLAELNGIPDAFGLDFDVTSINYGIFGFLLVAMMLLRPEGLIPSGRRRLELHEADLDEEQAEGLATGGTGDPTQLYEVEKA
jgi:branched-chain amino acid transport system permease protein